MKRLIRWIVAAGLATAMSPVAASMVVYPMSVDIGGGRGDGAQVQVRSNSDTPHYMKLNIVRVLDPATPQEREEVVSQADADALLAAPRRFVVPPHGMRTVRLLLPQAPSVETAYRIYFDSVDAPDDVVSELEIGEGATAKVGLHLVFGVLVRALPAADLQPAVNLIADRGLLHNSGNARAGVLELKLCGQQAGACQVIPVNRSLYPQQRMQLPAEASASALSAAGRLLLRYRDSMERVHEVELDR